MRKGSGWMFGDNGTMRCRNCLKAVGTKPANTCASVEHAKYYSKLVKTFAKKSLDRRWKRRLQVITLLGRACKCGITDIRVLQINHKKGKGSKEHKHRGGRIMVEAILSGKRTTDDLELRCANCNILYEYERGRLKIPAWVTF